VRTSGQRPETAQTAQAICALAQHCTTGCLCPVIIAGAAMSRTGFDAARCGNEKNVECVVGRAKLCSANTSHTSFVLRTQASMIFSQDLHKLLKLSMCCHNTAPPAVCVLSSQLWQRCPRHRDDTCCGSEKNVNWPSQTLFCEHKPHKPCSANTSFNERRPETVQTTQTVYVLRKHCTTDCVLSSLLWQ